MSYEFYRPPTNDELKNFIQLGVGRRKDVYNFFLSELSNVRAKFTKLFRPFDSYGARLDFDEKLRALNLAAQTAVKDAKGDLNIDIASLERYGDVERLDMVEVEDSREDKLLDGMRTSVITGRSYKFIAKQRGNVIFVMVPMYDVEHGVDEWMASKFSNHTELVERCMKLRPSSVKIIAEEERPKKLKESKKEAEN